MNIPLLIHGINTRRAAIKAIPKTPKFKPMTDTNVTKAEVEKLMDEAYNMGIDHAIEIVQEYRDMGFDHHALRAIISKLEALKKPIS